MELTNLNLIKYHKCLKIKICMIAKLYIYSEVRESEKLPT